jgi:hypothetical protein
VEFLGFLADRHRVSLKTVMGYGSDEITFWMAYYDKHPPGREHAEDFARLAYYAANTFRRVSFHKLKREFNPKIVEKTFSPVNQLLACVTNMPEHVAKRFDK